MAHTSLAWSQALADFSIHRHAYSFTVFTQQSEVCPGGNSICPLTKGHSDCVLPRSQYFRAHLLPSTSSLQLGVEGNSLKTDRKRKQERKTLSPDCKYGTISENCVTKQTDNQIVEAWLWSYGLNHFTIYPAVTYIWKW